VKSPTSLNLAKKARLELEFKSQLELQKATFESHLIDKMSNGNVLSVFHYLRNLKEGCSVPSTVNLNGVSALSNSDKATLFNKFFHSVYTTSF